ncbi:MAG: hypothetical protein ABIJ86_12975, partial [Spirochaetota bacterium]
AEYSKAERLIGASASNKTALNLQLNLATCYNAMNDTAKASVHLDRASRLDPAAAASLMALIQPATTGQDSTGSRASQSTQPGYTILFDE